MISKKNGKRNGYQGDLRSVRIRQGRLLVSWVGSVLMVENITISFRCQSSDSIDDVHS